MNISQLKYFCAVCELQTVSAAAEYLHISQPSLSNAIKELENEFGVCLFKRCYRGMTLTDEGQKFYEMSKDILNSAEYAENVMKDLGAGRKKLRLGIPPMIGSIILPYIYRDFFSENQDIVPEIVEGGRNELIKKLSENYLDMLFIPHSQLPDAGLSTMQVAKLEMGFCTSAENGKSDEIVPKQLENEPLVLFEDNFFQTEEIKKWFKKDGVEPDILLQTGQLSTMMTIISKNVASGFMFRKLVEDNDGIVYSKVNPPLYANVSLVWKKESYLFSNMKKFKEYVKEKLSADINDYGRNL